MNSGESLPVGHLLDGRYRIHKVLGQGGMGRVYLANDTRLANRPVAAKEMIVGDGIQEKKAIEDFNREASVLAKLSHPSIPQVIDYFAESSRHYLVMEFVAGGDLQHHLDKIGAGARFPENTVLRWAREILEVLQFLHAQKPPIVYRDLKPGNIMIDQHGRAMLVDFGIARFLPPGGRGTQIGSVGYAPPEQYLGKMEPRSDLYALAATIHHLLTGRDPQLEPPFSFPPVRQLAPEVSIQTERVVMTALDKDIDRRPRTAREMRDALPSPSADEEKPGMAGALASTAIAPALGAMKTIVLSKPAIAQSSVAVPIPAALAGSTAPPPKSQSARGNPGARQSTQRSLPLPIAPKPSPTPPPQVSSTAKTQDLGRKVDESAGLKRAGANTGSKSRVAAALSSVRAAVNSASSTLAQARKQVRTNEVSRPAPKTMEDPKPPVYSAPVRQSAQVASPRNGGPPLRTQAHVADARLVSLGDGAQFELFGARVVIGRAGSKQDEVDIDLSALRRGVDRISRRHAEIIRQGAEYFIRDLGSLNGTYISGRGRLSRDQLYKLRDRDEVVLGGAKLEFRRG